ncbi:hypothetical protein WJX72_001149 [[Myrmecia] bisecta]|uniref:BZIP domain-containing protein n=1 Tax=[Myrmecia] bisecta TaxID=41462 RepID=A0AAW1PI56_9CHLO
MSTTVACSVSDLTAAIHLEEDLLLSRPWPAVDLDPHGLPAVVGLGLGFELAQYQSNSVEPVQSLADPSAVLSKVPVMPGREAQRQSEEDAASESEVPTDGDGSTGSKAKALSSPEKKRKRRQEINRKSARRIRERRSQEVEDLKRQVAHLQKQLLLPYTAQITRDKDILQGGAGRCGFLCQASTPDNQATLEAGGLVDAQEGADACFGPTEKLCEGCKVVRSLVEFGAITTTLDGHHYFCRACVAERAAARHAARKPQGPGSPSERDATA